MIDHNLTQQADVLAFGAHPDDLEIGVGGLLIRAAELGLVVALCDLTAGERGTRGTPQIRRTEALEAAEVLGARSRGCLGLPDAELVDDRVARRAVARVIRSVRPRFIFGPCEIDLHPDHQAAARLVQAACFVAGLSRHEGLDGPAHRPEQRWSYLGLPGRGSGWPEVTQVVDVSSVYDQKSKAVRCHRSQFVEPDSEAASWRAGGPHPLERLDARDRFYGAQLGVRFGEPLLSGGPSELKLDGWLPSNTD